MAPSPEYDKEPKAPDKSVTNTPSDDPKNLHNLVNDQPANSDHKPTNSSVVDMEVSRSPAIFFVLNPKNYSLNIIILTSS